MTSAQCQQAAEDWFNKSVALYDQGNYADAIQALDEAIRQDPNDPNNAIAWNNKGLAFILYANTMKPSNPMKWLLGSIPRIPMPGSVKAVH
jgi:tetratricopeptide (TPR) repeat protein